MKGLTRVLIFSVVLAFIFSSIPVSANDSSTEVTREITSGEDTNLLTIEGIVTYNELESGFYEVGGYRLVGDIDFSIYKNKNCVVIGEIDNSPSIFMTKAVRVTSIKESINGISSELPTDKKSIQNQIVETENQIEALKKDLENAVDQYGENSEKVQEIREDLTALDSKLENLRLELYKIAEKERGYAVEPFVLEGYVTYNDLEGGFYELKGFRLVGDFSFRDYAGKVVSASGIEDISESIYMKRGFLVKHIEEIDTEEYTDKLKSQVEQSIKGAEDVENNLPQYINQYGEDSSEVNIYKEELNTLRNDAIYLLEELIMIDGQNVDLEKYRKLGKALSKIEKKISIYINGRKPVFEQEAAPVIEDGRTLVPFRAVAECIGAEVSWDADLKKVSVKKGDILVELFIGNKTAYVNGSPVELDVPAKIVHGRTVLPLRFVSESLRTTVEWIPDGQIIVIKYDEKQKKALLDTADFTVKYNEKEIKLGDWDDKVDIKAIFGEPLSENVKQLGQGADTFAGSYVKEIVYDGLTIGLMSPKQNGKTFFIDRIEITKGGYETSRGIKVGDGYSKILESYVYNPQEIDFDAQNHTYTFSDGSVSYIKFDVQREVIKSITLYIEHP
ncbi:MAG: stalk domain-containing protein [Bacillota bacterium]